MAYELAWRDSPDRLTAALNAHLPNDVAVRATEIAPKGFEPRIAATRRRYSYRVLVDPVRSPLEERTSWRVWPGPDYQRLQRASLLFTGKHDFGAFGRAPKPGGHTVRTITRCEWRQEGSLITLTIDGDAFLYHMVRRIVATTVAVGEARVDEQQIQASLKDPNRTHRSQLAPAAGLCLEAVFYED